MLQLDLDKYFFGFSDQLRSTLTRALNKEGKEEYALQAIYQDATTQPYAITPNDPLFSNQWHLTGANGINVQSVWDDYRGAGVLIGFVDDGVQYTHPDLTGNYDTAIDYDLQTNTGDGAPRSSNDKHGTTTAGVAAGVGNNGVGLASVAYEADVSNFRLPFGQNLTDSQFATLFIKQLQAGVEVSNNSWGFGGFFDDNFKTIMPQVGNAIEDLAELGRGGLGTVTVFAAGNGRADGQNTNYHNMDNSQYTIAVAATDQNGKFTSFSTPGASLLVSAPGSGISSTDRTGSDGYVSGDYVGGLAGTSYSSPIVAGVVALMLEANPNLGYRDVQEILAYSARNSDTANAGWKINGATNWNGGGLHFSHDYGFGLVDALAAVRLAETWNMQSTFANRDMIASGLSNVASAIPDNNANGITRSINVSSDLVIDRVEVDVNIAHTQIGDLILKLTSPNGTVSTLVDRPGKTSGWFGAAGSSQDNINFTFGTTATWGETGNGTWTLQVIDARSGNTGSFTSWGIRLYGDTDVVDDTYIYTNEYSEMRASNAARGTLTDASGVDTLNFAAVGGNTVLNLNGGSNSTVDGAAFNIAAGTEIENAYLGDGNDTVTGNDAANFIYLGRGNDTAKGHVGDDTINGAQGFDIAQFVGSYLEYSVYVIDSITVRVTDLVVNLLNEGIDLLLNMERIQFSDGFYLFNNGVLTPPPNLAPTADDETVSLDQDTSININVLLGDTDPENAVLSVTGIDDTPDHGTAVINPDKTVTYTPTAGYSGSDSFTYIITDGAGGFDTGAVFITVNPVAPPPPPPNLAPTADDETVSLNQDTNLIINVLDGDTDPENDTLTVTSISDTPDHGTAVINPDKTVTYTPTAGYAGSDSFLYTISDGHGNVDTGAVFITVNAVVPENKLVNGTPNSETLGGGEGNDTINGLHGEDTITGQGGNDSIDAGYGHDVVYGGNGNDTIIGNYGFDTIDGGAGDDSIDGGYSSDLLIGGSGSDWLFGYSGTNTLVGGLDADTFLTADDGRDLFVYEVMGDAGDIIQGFKRNQDKIDLHQLLTSIGYAGTDPVADGIMSTTKMPDGDLRLFIDADAGGVGAPVLLVTLDNFKFASLILGTDYIV